MIVGSLIKFGVLVAVLGIMTNGIVRFLMYMDLNKRVYNHVPGGCSEVHGVHDGAVDMEYIQSLGTVIITSGTKLYNTTDMKYVKGTVYAYNVSGRSNWELKLESKALTEKNFNPHGIGVWEEGNKVFVFIVNHRKKIDTVEIFRFKSKKNEKSLSHIKTVKSPLFTNLRDVVAVGPDRFYATNYHYFKQGTLQTLELYLALRVGSVLYFDGRNTTTVQRWIGTPSGIALDKSKRYIYVSTFTGEAILIYKIAKDGNLTKFSEIPLYTSPEHIFVDPYTADLYVGCHPLKNRIFRYESAPKSIYTPSQVLKLRGRPAKEWSISEVYANDGATLSGSSVAVKVKDTLLIGSLHDKMLNCDLEAAELL